MKLVLGKGRFLQLVSESGWEFAERIEGTGVVAVIALTDEGKLLLTEQYRPAVKGRVIDLPAGLAGDADFAHNEDLAEAARRELLEECGYEADSMLPLLEVPTSPGLTSEVVSFFRAGGLRKVHPGGGDESEEIDVLEVPLADFPDWLHDHRREGKWIDPKVPAALYFLSRPEKP